MPRKRDYKKEYASYHAKPVQKKRRAQRNKSRRIAKKRGMNVKGKDVDHRDHNTANNSRTNLRVTSKSVNRSRNRPKKRR